MKKRLAQFASLVLLSVLVLSACGAMATAAPAQEPFFAPTEAPEATEPAIMDSAAEAVAKAGGEPAIEIAAATAMPLATGEAAPNAAPNVVRMIIKNADIKLLVADTDVAVSRATQIVGDAGGYIISSRIWYEPYYDGQNYKYATITVGVPVMEFERILNRLREISVQVLDESASGEDVTDQYVDLKSQLANLEATRDRIKTFLDQAQTVDEALRINAQLADIEGQIEIIKGKMNYFADRSSFSTITINFQPVLPEMTPTPTATIIPTSTPTAWNPGQTFNRATKTVVTAYQAMIDFFLWIFVVFVPIFAPFGLLAWGFWKLLRRKIK